MKQAILWIYFAFCPILLAQDVDMLAKIRLILPKEQVQSQFESLPFATATYFKVSEVKWLEIKAQIDENIAPDSLLKAFPTLKIHKNNLVTLQKDYQNKTILQNISGRITFTVPISEFQATNLSARQYIIYKNDKGGTELLYLDTPLKTQIYPPVYAKSIDYVNQLSALIIEPKGERLEYQYDIDTQEDLVSKFVLKLRELSDFPDFKKVENPEKAFQSWRIYRFQKLDSLMQDTALQKELSIAYQAALQQWTSTAEFEEYIERYLSKEDALTLKLQYGIYVDCGQSTDRQEHYLEIIRLAEETGNAKAWLTGHYFMIKFPSPDPSLRPKSLASLQDASFDLKEIMQNTLLKISGTEQHKIPFDKIIFVSSNSDNPLTQIYFTAITKMIMNPDLDDYTRLYLMQHFKFDALSKRNEAWIRHYNEKLLPNLPAHLAIHLNE
jgi:hypothetical protein